MTLFALLPGYGATTEVLLVALTSNSNSVLRSRRSQGRRRAVWGSSFTTSPTRMRFATHHLIHHQQCLCCLPTLSRSLGVWRSPRILHLDVCQRSIGPHLDSFRAPPTTSPATLGQPPVQIEPPHADQGFWSEKRSQYLAASTGQRACQNNSSFK